MLLPLLAAAGCRRGPAAPPTLPVTSSFLQNDEGWTVTGDGDLFYSSTGGNPGSTGYIFAIDRVLGQTFYFQAPARFRGNVGEAYGRYLMFDLIWLETAPGGYKDDEDVIMRGADMNLAARLPQRPVNTWTSYAVALDPSGGWFHMSTEQPATAAEIQAVLGSLQQLLIRGEFREGPEQGGLDNVKFGAMP